MIATKRKRKLTFEGKNYYWYIREEGTDWRSPVIHIISEDKKLRLAYHFDRDIAIGTQYIKDLLAMYKYILSDIIRFITRNLCVSLYWERNMDNERKEGKTPHRRMQNTAISCQFSIL